MRGGWLAGVLACLVVASGCANTVGGRAEPAAGASSATLPGSCRPSDLLACIVPAPAGSAPYSTPLGPNGAVTARQFVSAFYPDDAQYNNQIADQLQTQGLQAIAHRNWAVTQGDQADVVLLGFTTARGAQQRARVVEDSTRRDPTLSTFTGPGLPNGVVAFVDRTVDKYGNIGVRAYAAYGQVELEFNYFHPSSLDTADLAAQVDAEVALLNA